MRRGYGGVVDVDGDGCCSLCFGSNRCSDFEDFQLTFVNHSIAVVHEHDEIASSQSDCPEIFEMIVGDVVFSSIFSSSI